MDLDAGTLTIATQLTQDGRDVVESEPKTDAGARVVALDSGTVSVLRTHRALARDRMQLGPAWVEPGQVCTSENGE